MVNETPLRGIAAHREFPPAVHAVADVIAELWGVPIRHRGTGEYYQLLTDAEKIVQAVRDSDAAETAQADT